VISGLRLEVDENCALLGYKAACSGSYLPTSKDNLSDPFLIPDDGTDRLSRNVGNELPLLAA